MFIPNTNNWFTFIGFRVFGLNTNNFSQPYGFKYSDLILIISEKIYLTDNQEPKMVLSH